MRTTLMFFGIGLSTLLGGVYAQDNKPTEMSADDLIKLAPCISLKEKDISTFEVKGVLNMDGIKLRFIMSGKQPDKIAFRILDPNDNTPLMVGVDNTFALYDPVTSQILTGGTIPEFHLKTVDEKKKDGETGSEKEGLSLFFMFRPPSDKAKTEEEEGKEKEETNLIDLRSIMVLLKKPKEIQIGKGGNVVLSGMIKEKTSIKAYVTPSRKAGPYAKFELFKTGQKGPALVLDDIMLNQPLPDTRFIFPEKKLQNSGLPIKKMTINNTAEMGLVMRRMMMAIMARLVLMGSDDLTLKSNVEKMSLRALDWEKMKADDKRVSPTLKSIFGVESKTEPIEMR